MSPYPVIFDVHPPERFDRVQVVLRLAIFVVLGLIGVSFGWLFLLLYFALPAAAAIVIQSQGADRYLGETAPSIAQFLRWLLSFVAYQAFVSDRFPTGGDSLARLEVAASGHATPQTALARLLTSVPEAIALAVLAFISSIVSLLSLIMVLLTRTVPAPLLAYQRGFLRFAARWLAYHASLVEPMPPFALDTGPAVA